MSNGEFVPGPPQSPTQPLPLAGAPPALTQPPIDRHIRRGQEEYAHALSALLPQGIAWPRWSESVVMKVVNGLAGIMGFVDGRAADLLERESDPRQTIELLSDWERNWGLPECGLPLGSIGERQTALVLKMTLLGGQSRQFFTDVARRLGYEVTITEYRPFMVGVDRAGDNREYLADGSLTEKSCQIGDPIMRFVWTVHLSSSRLTWFRASRGQAGIDPHLSIARAADLECFYRKWAPAHTIVLFDYSKIGDPYAEAKQFNVVLRTNEQVKLRDGTPIVQTPRQAIPLYAAGYSLGSPTFYYPSVATHPLYVANAVHFDGMTYLSCDTLSMPDSPYWMTSFWIKTDGSDCSIWVVDPANSYTNYVWWTGYAPVIEGEEPGTLELGGGTSSQWFGIRTINLVDPSDWIHVLFAIDTSVPRAALYINGQRVDVKIVSTAEPIANCLFHGLSMIIGADLTTDPDHSNGNGDYFTGDLADLWIATGTNYLDFNGNISASFINMFIDGNGSPTNPASFPPGNILMTGNAQQFSHNQGTGGTFAVTGTLTNATSSPSQR
jgi:uncharacterized protein YmfQ (DUF2313 family)